MAATLARTMAATTLPLPAVPSKPLAIPHARPLFSRPPRLASSPSPLTHRSRISLSNAIAPLPLQDHPTCSPSLMQELVEFLQDDLPHLFDDQGINKDRYEKTVDFKDPITRYNSVEGYLFNIQMLRLLFRPTFELHGVKQSGPNEITTRWTMTMKFALLPWRPELIFTGVSIMGVNPTTGKFVSHVDYWDSIRDNEYFSLEGVVDLIKQLRYYKTPDLETPAYKVLKRTDAYEVREYEPFIVVEAQGDQLTGSKGFGNVTGYIFGKNQTGERIPMTTPVITKTSDESQSDVCIQIVLPSQSELSNLPAPLLDSVKLKQMPGGFMAAIKFSGTPTEEVIMKMEKLLRSALTADGLSTKAGFMLARYNDPGRTWSFVLRNEVLISLEEFTLE